MFRRRKPEEEFAASIYKRTAEQSRTPDLFESCGIPDNLYGRFDSLSLHAALMIDRLRREPDGDALAQAFFDAMFRHLDLTLRDIAAKHKVIGDVRGLGSMVAIELFENGDHDKPAAELVGKIVARARDKGLILLSCGTYYNVIRFLMPVTIPDAQLEKGIAIVAECFDELA